MNIGNLSSSSTLLSTTSTSATATTQPIGSDADDATGAGTPTAVRGGHHHGGGHIGHAVADALKSLGLSLPQPAAPNSGDDAAPSAGDSGQASSVSATGELRSDLHDLMHAMFEAVKGQQQTAGGATNGAADPSHASSSFSSGLASLISQVSSGNAPADLQAAFTKLEGDLPGTTAVSASADATTPTLQAFLTKLQDGLGYGTSASTTAAGAIVSCGA